MSVFSNKTIIFYFKKRNSVYFLGIKSKITHLIYFYQNHQDYDLKGFKIYLSLQKIKTYYDNHKYHKYNHLASEYHTLIHLVCV